MVHDTYFRIGSKQSRIYQLHNRWHYDNGDKHLLPDDEYLEYIVEMGACNLACDKATYLPQT